MSDETKDDVMTRVNRLEEYVAQLELRLQALENPQNPFQPFVDEHERTKNVCPKCRLEWSGVMQYVCSSSDCPMQTNITCSTSGG